jgi:hypothetical protein
MVMSVSTPPMPIADVLALEQELIALGPKSFDWTPPNEPLPKKWILDPVKWDMDYSTGDLAALSFTLKRWYV